MNKETFNEEEFKKDSYWYGNGLYQKEYENDGLGNGVHKSLCEAFMSARRFYYDIFNNGACNLCNLDIGDYDMIQEFSYFGNNLYHKFSQYLDSKERDSLLINICSYFANGDEGFNKKLWETSKIMDSIISKIIEEIQNKQG